MRDKTTSTPQGRNVKARHGNAGNAGDPVRTPEPTGDFITLARVVKTQGRHGEVAVEVHSDVPERFAAGMKLFALDKSGERRREIEIEDLWPHKGLVVLKFGGIDSISDAENLIGSELQVSAADRAPLDAGWTYVSDLIGCAMVDHGREIGQIEDVQFGAGEAPLLIVAANSVKKYDVPFAEAYLERVDVAKREVYMKLPEGMLEINAPMTAEEKQEQMQARQNDKQEKRSQKSPRSRRPLR